MKQDDLQGEINIEVSEAKPKEASHPAPEGEEIQEREIPLEEMNEEQLRAKVSEIQEAVDKNYDLYLRSQAEMENLKKRFTKEKEDLVKFSNESLIKQLLVVMDNLRSAITHSRENGSIEALQEGVELTLKGLMDTLEKAGLETVKAVGEPFDPNFHEAVSEQEDGDVAPGTVLYELQRGYILNQRLIRPAMVVVSKGPAE